VSAEKLQQARIIVLKATHLPIVGAIWVFERLHDHFRGGAMVFSTMGPQSKHDENQRVKKQLPFLSKSHRSFSNKHLSQNFIDTPIEAPDHHVLLQVDTGERVQQAQNKNLEKMVEDLSAKIAELTTLVLAQQGGTGLPDGSF